MKASLGQLAWLFGKLGTTAFGGPAAHVAMMEAEVVRRRGWLGRDRFLDLLAAANLIPGPNSTELAIHIGYDQRGWAGLLVAGVCFITPAMLIVMAISWAYVAYGTLPAAQSVLYGIKPVILAIIAQALWNLGRTAVKTWRLGVIAAWALIVIALGLHELAVLGLAGGFACAFAAARRRAAAVIVPLPALFAFFAKVGAVLYGSGYVLIAFLQSDLVERWRWLTEAQLLDAIAVGQVTPGPVFTTATFVGYLLDGPGGALVATAGIFAPAFVFVAVSGPLVPRIRKSPVASAFLDGVSVASLALMAWAGAILARSTLVDPATIAIAAVTAVVLIRYKPNATYLIAAGAVIGLVVRAA